MTPPSVDIGIDPVCGMTVRVLEAQADGRAFEFNGESYVFCSDGCLVEFRESPETYAEQATAD